MQVTILGCGASMGVPVMGCKCLACNSSNPKNKRSRVSLHIKQGDTSFIIDSSPDLRQQSLANNISQIEAILYTHYHADHTSGIDDIRPFNMAINSALPIYGDFPTMEELKARFPYIFAPPLTGKGWYKASVIPKIIEPYQSFRMGEVEILPFHQIHGKINSLGFRINDFAYSTDLNILPAKSKEYLKNLEYWIVDCQSYQELPTHSYLEKTLLWINELKPKLAILTHMSHELEYDELTSKLPANVVAGYDNMTIVCA